MKTNCLLIHNDVLSLNVCHLVNLQTLNDDHSTFDQTGSGEDAERLGQHALQLCSLQGHRTEHSVFI